MRLRPRLPERLNVLGVAVLVELGLRSLRLPRLARMLGIRLDVTSAEPPRGTTPKVPIWGVHCADEVDRVMQRWPVGDTCLRRCLVLGHRLRGLGPVLRIGVQREDDGRLVAHSWLELDGQSLDPLVGEFEVLGGVAQSPGGAA